MKKYFWFCIVALCVLTTACSKTEYDNFATLYGMVSDSAAGNPIANATVVLSPGGTTKMTGNDGRFEFSDLEPQQYTITVQKSGYQTNRKSITAIVGEQIEVNITLYVQ
ncbi:MAG: carboxypeptidase-like regulatory domain-containing protein [Alistipes sp.]|nr:carboxypeptidase-like regulatory domain-containing protein [Alistipes senegalensis]MCM1250457.1 carboxypeptidase-like regulatory domain-containing protein [Alistipes sp.]